MTYITGLRTYRQCLELTVEEAARQAGVPVHKWRQWEREDNDLGWAVLRGARLDVAVDTRPHRRCTYTLTPGAVDKIARWPNRLRSAMLSRLIEEHA